MVPELHRTQAEAFDGPLVGAALDILADPESIVEQIEDAGDDVLDQRLRAEADRHADHAGAGDQRPDLDPERGQHHQQPDDHDCCEQHVLENRQQRAHARLSRILLPVRGRRRPLHLAEPHGDDCLDDAPAEISGKDDDGGIDAAAHEAVGEVVARRHAGDVDPPCAGKQRRTRNDQHHADATVDYRDQHRRDRLGIRLRDRELAGRSSRPCAPRMIAAGTTSAATSSQYSIQAPATCRNQTTMKYRLSSHDQPLGPMAPRCGASACACGSGGRSQTASRMSTSWMKLVGMDMASRLVLSKPNVPISWQGDDDEHQPEHVDADPAMPVAGTVVGHREDANLAVSAERAGSAAAGRRVVTIVAAPVTIATER